MQHEDSDSWLTYAKRFSQMCKVSEDVTLTLEFGEGVEDWALTECPDSLANDFKMLSRKAGEALYAVHLVNHETGSRVEPEVRWFRLLKEQNRQIEAQPLVIDQEGVAVYAWSLPEAVQRSIDLSAQLQRTNPIHPTQSRLARAFHTDRAGTILKLAGGFILVGVLIRLGLK